MTEIVIKHNLQLHQNIGSNVEAKVLHRLNQCRLYVCMLSPRTVHFWIDPEKKQPLQD